jgi:starch phosphorylase
VPQLGTLDGWWAEGFDGENGWLIPAAHDPAHVDEADWEHLFRILEQEVVPLYHDRDEHGVPLGWTRRMKRALWVAGRHFITDRMVREYVDDYYAPSLRADVAPAADRPPTA